MATSKSNEVTRKRFRKSNMDNVEGNRIIIDGPKIVRRVAGKLIKKSATPEDNGDDLRRTIDPDIIATNPDLDQENDMEEMSPEIASVQVVTSKDSNMATSTPEKIKFSLSGDVIFTPYTDATQYACRRDAKANLQRRMPGFDILISDVTGEGQIDFTVSNDFEVEGQQVVVTARGLASPYEMAVHSITINYKGKEFTVTPVDRARSPEDTVNFLNRVAVNCANGVYA